MARKMVVARETCCVTWDARPTEFVNKRVIVKKTGELSEHPIDIHELPPVDEGSLGMSQTFKAGEKVAASHPAVKAAPGAFIDPDEDE